jgi:hypothetical protein
MHAGLKYKLSEKACSGDLCNSNLEHLCRYGGTSIVLYADRLGFIQHDRLRNFVSPPGSSSDIVSCKARFTLRQELR